MTDPTSDPTATPVDTMTSGMTVTIDVQALMGAMVPQGYDHDRDQPYGGTLRDEILGLVAANLAAKIQGDITAIVSQLVNQRIETAVELIVAQTLAEGVRQTDTWGQPKGETITVAALVREEAERYMKQRDDDRYRDRSRTSLAKTVENLVDRTFKAELAKTVEAAKKDVLAKVHAAAAEVITETIARSVR